MVTRWMIAVAVSVGIATGVANGAVTNLEELVYDTLTVEDSDVRTECLSSIRISRGLSDDEFSAILVKMANRDEVRKSPLLRGFTMGAIMDFGTTNALDFLENEALHGPNVAAGITGFAIITGFDDRCFAMLEKVTSDWGEANRHRRSNVYTLMRSALFSGANDYMRCVKPGRVEDVRQRMLSFLMSATEHEMFEDTYLDKIIIQHMPEYEQSERRRAIALKLMNSSTSDEYTVNYFRNELQKLEAEEAHAKAYAESQGAADGEPESSVATADGRNESPRPNGKSGMVTLAVVTVALAVGCAIMFMRRRKQLSSPRGGFRKDKDF